MQQLSDKGSALDTEEAIAEQQQEEDERNGPVVVPTPVQLKCTLQVVNEGEPPRSSMAASSLLPPCLLLISRHNAERSTTVLFSPFSRVSVSTR